jgi:hypothetical protein
MNKKVLDDLLLTRRGPLSQMEEMHRDLIRRRDESLGGMAVRNAVTRAEELAALTIQREHRHLGHVGRLIEQMPVRSAAERYALSSLAAERVQGSIRSATEAFIDMRFGEQARRGLVGRLSEPLEPAAARLHTTQFWRRDEERWQKVFGSDLLAKSPFRRAAEETAAAYHANLGVMVNRLEASHLLDVRPRYAERLIEPALHHSRYTTETIERMTTAANARESLALQGSLTLFNDQLSRLTSAIMPLIAPPLPQRGRNVYWPPAEFNLPAEQRDELLEHDELPEEADYETLSPLAPSSSVADDVIACLMLYERCNEARRFGGKNIVFTPTTRGTVAACRLAMIVTDTQEQFDVFVDQLYMLFYEGGGGQKIKLMKENGGVMERAEGEALWDVKQLRSKRARHDIDHGSEGEIRKKYRDLREMYERLGLSRFPQSSEEYRQLQRAVLRNLRIFLTEAAERFEREVDAAEGEND